MFSMDQLSFPQNTSNCFSISFPSPQICPGMTNTTRVFLFVCLLVCIVFLDKSRDPTSFLVILIFITSASRLEHRLFQKPKMMRFCTRHFNNFMTFFLKVNFDKADVPTHHEYIENVRIARCLTSF